MNIANNKYYIRKAEGGYSPCILGNNSSGQRNATLNVLPNCVGWAVGRFNELGNYGSCKYLGNSNANWFMNWAKQQGLQTGSIPKKGACMVWDNGNAGHVAIVENVNSDTQVYVSESGWNSKSSYWNATLSKGNGNWTSGESWLNNGNYKFLGFIYNPNVIDFGPVQRDTKKDQVQIVSKELRIRKEPSLSASIYQLAQSGYYNVYEIKNNDGYDWYRIGEERWVASNEGNWTIFLAGNPYNYEKIETKRMIATINANVWDLSFDSWSKTKSIRKIEVGTQVDIVAKYKHKLGGLYYITKEDYESNIFAGINAVDLKEYVEEPIVIEEKPEEIIEEAIDNIVDETEGVVKQDPEVLDTYKENKNFFITLIRIIINFVKQIINYKL